MFIKQEGEILDLIRKRISHVIQFQAKFLREEKEKNFIKNRPFLVYINSSGLENTILPCIILQNCYLKNNCITVFAFTRKKSKQQKDDFKKYFPHQVTLRRNLKTRAKEYIINKVIQVIYERNHKKKS